MLTPNVQASPPRIEAALARAFSLETLGDVQLVNGFDDPVINGQFSVAQRGTSIVNPASQYVIDTWRYEKTGSYSHTVSQSSPTINAPYHVPNALRLNLTTPQASIGAAEYCGIQHHVEGYRFAPYFNRAFQLRFRVNATLPGLYCVVLRSGGTDRNFCAPYTVNTPATWEEKVVDVPASGTSGTWDLTSGRGLQMFFSIASGSSFLTASPGLWSNGNALGVVGQVNGVQAGATDFSLADVRILPAGAAGLLIPRSFDQQLRLAQRYYWKSFLYATAPAQNAGTSGVISMRLPYGGAGSATSMCLTWPAPMRVTPTVTFFNPSAANANWRNSSANADSGAGVVISNGESNINFGMTLLASDLVQHLCQIHMSASADL